MKRVLVPARIFLAQRDLAVILVCGLLLGLALSFVVPFYSMFGTIEVGMSNWTFGVFMTITSVAGIFISTILAQWSDTRFSRRAILLLGCACGAAGYASYAHVRNVITLTVIGSVALGISSITFAQLFAYAREAIARHGVSDKEAPLYMNIYRLVFSLAWTVGPAIASWVMVWFSFKGTFLICGGIFFVLLVIVWGFVPALPPTAIAMGPPVSLMKLLVRPDLLCYFCAFVLVFVCMTMGLMDLPLMILKTLHGTEQQIGIAYSLQPVFELPLMALFGVLATKGESPPLIRLGMIIAIAYYALLFFVQAPWEIYPLQILSAAMVAIVSGIAITFFQDYIPNQPGTATNLYTNANRLGSSIGYLSFGTLTSVLGYRSVFLVCSAVCAGAFILLWLTRETHEAAATA